MSREGACAAHHVVFVQEQPPWTGRTSRTWLPLLLLLLLLLLVRSPTEHTPRTRHHPPRPACAVQEWLESVAVETMTASFDEEQTRAAELVHLSRGAASGIPDSVLRSKVAHDGGGHWSGC
jgi:hypothetical protein